MGRLANAIALSRKPIPLDVRLVTATNIDLRRAVDAQHFRADLFYRIGVATVDLPPLRERPGDVLPLAEHFMNVYAPRLNLSAPQLTPEAQAALLAYSWPGNIRELENVLHFALIVCKDGVVQATDLRLVGAGIAPAAAIAASAALPASVSVAPDWVPADLPHVEAGSNEAAAPSAEPELQLAIQALLQAKPPDLQRLVERTLVTSAFRHVGDNQVRGARLLGVTRNTFRTLLKRHGLLADGSAPDEEGFADDAASAAVAANHLHGGSSPLGPLQRC
jgi:sigma-54-specific transcriptional regulator